MELAPAESSQNVFFRCVEDSNDAIMISDIQGVLMYVNPAWSRLYGYSAEEALGKTPRILHSGAQGPEFYRRMWKEILDPKGAGWKGELVNRAKDGRRVPVLLTVTSFRSQVSGEPLGYMAIAVDLTREKALEASVAHQDRLASIGLLASGLAHEIGTPMGVIRGRSEILMERAKDPEVRKYLEVITSEIDRITKIIRSLLRAGRSLGEIQLEPVDVGRVAEEVMSLLRSALQGDGVEIGIRVPEGTRARADFSRLEQVLLNLVMNSAHAIREAKQGGRAGPHFLRIEAGRGDDGTLEISVEDSGCGIAPGNLKRIFEPFFTTKDVGEGTGLGLSIVAQLVREMGGEIAVQSELGRGAKFVVTLQKA